ncbi:SCO1/SenC family protein [Candidatus Magnetobacterium bavaricum]|uniref:SCO1/SenC family protein n=1 Tax=Candidatus Magnetobacterium bavaricum TaxID=29290 RepID=A0A0F3GPB2_9BACT|nr:SCO1/SenC family protein [Candidatus Magnetobacterium bavaricum]
MPLKLSVLSLLIAVGILATNALAAPPLKGKSDFDPSILKIKEDDFLGKVVPEATMTDDVGNTFSLGKYKGKPLLLSIIYFRCATACPVLNEGLSEALSNISLRLGDDYNVITLSFDDKEGPADGQWFRKNLAVKMKDKIPQDFNKWVFATADAAQVKKLTEATGYRFFYMAQDKLFVHPNVYIFLSPEGVITRYIFGLYPPSIDIRLALVEAGRGKIGKTPLLSSVALACYKYDAAIGGYRLDLPRVFAGMGVLVGLFTGLVVFVYWRSLKKQRAKTADFQP